MSVISEGVKEVHLNVLMQEAKEGKIKRDILPNSAFEFSGEVLANYSALTRVFSDSYLAHLIMVGSRDDADVVYAEIMRGNEDYGGN